MSAVRVAGLFCFTSNTCYKRKRHVTKTEHDALLLRRLLVEPPTCVPFVTSACTYFMSLTLIFVPKCLLAHRKMDKSYFLGWSLCSEVMWDVKRLRNAVKHPVCHGLPPLLDHIPVQFDDERPMQKSWKKGVGWNDGHKRMWVARWTCPRSWEICKNCHCYT